MALVCFSLRAFGMSRVYAISVWFGYGGIELGCMSVF